MYTSGKMSLFTFHSNLSPDVGLYMYDMYFKSVSKLSSFPSLEFPLLFNTYRLILILCYCCLVK